VLLDGSLADIVWISVVAAAGIAAIAAGTGGYLRRAASPFERGLLVAGGLLMFAGTVGPIAVGAIVVAMAVGWHLRRIRAPHL
jgi:TRAP-type uncharacterized transport system fused permease subunit